MYGAKGESHMSSDRQKKKMPYTAMLKSLRITPKIRVILKNSSNKSCWTLNCIQKSQWDNMSISPTNGARGHKGLIWIKYYYVQKRKITSTLGLNVAKNTVYMEKRFK